MKLKKIFAFTLAEVLITLSILGVVAAITVPSLIQKNRRNEVQTKMRKHVATITNLLDTAEAESGKYMYQWDFTNQNGIIDTYLKPRLNILKDCRTDSCDSYNYYYQDAKTRNTIYGSQYSPTFVLKDGLTMTIKTNQGAYGDIVILYDINGKKAPNSVGKDIFWDRIHTKTTGGHCIEGLGACASEKTSYNDATVRVCKTEIGSGHGGLYCTQWIYGSSIKIPSDYPWL